MAILHFTLATRNVEKSASFFERTLGWPRIDYPQNVGAPAAWLRIADGQELHLVEVSDFAPSRCEREYGRHIAVSFPRAQFADLKRRLGDEGAEVIAPLRETPFERFFFRDPNGYVFEIIDAEREPPPSNRS